MNVLARIGVAALIGLALVHSVDAAPDRTPLQVPLTVKSLPKSDQPNPIPGAQERSIALVVQDGRGAERGSVIGQAVNDGVAVYPIFATNDVRAYAEEITRGLLGQWGLRVGEPTHGTLVVRFTRFDVAHNNRAVGATYVGNSTIEYTLSNRRGKVMARGTASGNVDHYGRGRSAEGVNEVLSESLANALSHMLNDSRFRLVWSNAPEVADAPSPAAKPAKPALPAKKAPVAGSTKSIESRLRQLDELLQGGAITQAEYDRRRTAILDEI